VVDLTYDLAVGEKAKFDCFEVDILFADSFVDYGIHKIVNLKVGSEFVRFEVGD